MPNMVIVNSGLQAAKRANLNGLKLRVRSFKLGKASGYEANSNTVGLRDEENPVAAGALSVSAKGNIVNVGVNLISADSYNFGEVGIYLETGELFAIAVYPETKNKSATDRFTFTIKISLNREGASIAFELTEHKNVPEISDYHLLPSPRVPGSNFFLVGKENDYGESGIVYKHPDNNKWVIENYSNVVQTGNVDTVVQTGNVDTAFKDSNADAPMRYDPQHTALVQFTSGAAAGQVRRLPRGNGYNEAGNVQTFILAGVRDSVSNEDAPAFPTGVEKGDKYEVLTDTPAVNQIYLHSSSPRLKDHDGVVISTEQGQGLSISGRDADGNLSSGSATIASDMEARLDIGGLGTATPADGDIIPFERRNIGSNDKARSSTFNLFTSLFSLGVTDIRIHTYDIEEVNVGFGRLGGSGYRSELVHRHEGKKVRRWEISRSDSFTSGAFNLIFSYRLGDGDPEAHRASIKHNASSEDIRKTLESLGPFNVLAVSGEGSISRPWRIEFTDAEGNEVPRILSDGRTVTPGTNLYYILLLSGQQVTTREDYVLQSLSVNMEDQAKVTLSESMGTSVELAPRSGRQESPAIKHVPGSDVTMCMVVLEGGGGSGGGTSFVGSSTAVSAGSSGGTAIKFVRPDEIPYGAEISLGHAVHSTFIKGHGLGGVRSEDYVTIPSRMQPARSSHFSRLSATGINEYGICSATGGHSGLPHYRQDQVGDIGIRTTFMNGNAPGVGKGADLNVGGQQGAGTDRSCRGGNSVMGGCGHRYHLDAGIFNRLLGKFETGFASGGAGGILFNRRSIANVDNITAKPTDFLGRRLPSSACSGDGADSVCIIVEFIGE